MGYDFHNNKGGYFSLNVWAWPTVVELAQMYGWNPAGTEPPAGPPEGVEVVRIDLADAQVIGNIKHPHTHPTDEYRQSKSWAGGYFSNDWQYVTEADALALAAALERAMPDLPDEDLRPVKKMKLLDGRGREIEINALADNAEDDPKLFWSGPEHKAYLQEFINLCKQGRFAIG
jgi:hypothetical protein